MTEAEVRAIIAQVDKEKAAQAPDGWSAEARAWAEETGIIQGTTTGMQYKAPCTREQMVTFLHRLWKLLHL